MSNIQGIDKNLQVNKILGEGELCFYNVKEYPFRVYGLYDSENQKSFKRLPDEVGKNINEGIAGIYTNTAGGRVSFSTTSKYVAIKSKMPNICRLPHMTLAGTSGFYLYINSKGKSIYYRTFMPPYDMVDGYESIIHFADNSPKDITVNFPLYNDVDELYIGLQQSEDLKEGQKYRNIKPVVYYGSSITQGGCASRPGNSYQSIIARETNIDYMNLGFSGNARGEKSMADYIADFDMSALVLDYDYNAPSKEHLKNTHKNFFEIVRNKNSILPIIMLSRPNVEIDIKDSKERREIIEHTFKAALEKGDKNVYFIGGESLFGTKNRDCCTVDGYHPNDCGFVRMAEVIEYVLKKII